MGMDLDMFTPFFAAHDEANEEHKKVDALRQDIKRLRDLLRRCLPESPHTASLYDDIRDELAKE